MAKARVFLPKNRLKHIIGGPNDMTAEMLIQGAEARLAELEPALKADVSDWVAAIERIAALEEEFLFAQCLSVSRAALSICEVAGAAGLGPLGDAARGIVSMVDALISQGVWHTDALQLHIDALSMFAANPSLPSDEVRRVLARLQVLRDEIGVQE
jgi:hypothetical protein